MKHKIIVFGLLLAFLLTPTAWAGEVTDSMQIGVTIINGCTVSAADMAFPDFTYDQVTAQTTLEINCSDGQAVTIEIDHDHYSGADPDFAGSGIIYQLYSDAAYNSVWNLAPDNVSYTGSGNPETLTVYGVIPGGQSGTAGTYTTGATVKVTW